MPARRHPAVAAGAGLLMAGLASLAFHVPSAGAAGAAAPATDPLRGQQWNLDLIRADAAHAVTEGQGAVVAVVDTGVDTAHPDLQGRLLGGYDFVDGTASMHDGEGHGTHVTGIIAADEGNGIGIEGVAPLAQVLPVKALDDSGNGSDATIAQGIDWAVAHGAEVINLSLGEPLPLDAILGSATGAAISRALAAGVVVVAAAGNESLPLCDQQVSSGLLCVGAVGPDGRPASYSNSGLNVNVLAPGGAGTGPTSNDILSTWNDGGYAAHAGTSMAAPHVAGVAALLVSLGLRGAAVSQRILASEAPGGLLDAQAAVAGFAPLPLPVAAPSASAPAAKAKSSKKAKPKRHRPKHRAKRTARHRVKKRSHHA
jgi:subtilisin family serine protease